MRKTAKQEAAPIFDVNACREIEARSSYVNAEGRVTWVEAKLWRYTATDGKPLDRDPAILCRIDTHDRNSREIELQFPPEAAEAVAVLLTELVKAARRFEVLPPASEV